MTTTIPDQARAQRSRLRVLEAGLASFAERGFEATRFADVAREAGVSVGLACRYFPTKEHLALALYQRLAGELGAWAAAGLPAGTVAERFEAAVGAKLGLIEPHRRTLVALLARALDPGARAAVFGPHTDVVRSTVSAVFSLVVSGASDAPGGEAGEALARLLYAAHLGLVLLRLQDGSADGRVAREAVGLVRGGLEALGPALPLLLAAGPGRRVDAMVSELLGSSRGASSAERARRVLGRLMRRRRVLPGVDPAPSEAALALHLPRVQAMLDSGEPIELVLPAFPAKAPNPRKVLGRRPDAAERLALAELGALVAELAEAHPAGARLVLCTDGGVFADVVGVSDRDVAAYRQELEAMVAGVDAGGGTIRLWGLDDAFGDVGPAAARRLLLERWAPSAGEPTAAQAAQLDGLHRFLFEDAIAADPSLTRSQARKLTRPRAHEVQRRSEAWGRLVAAAFPRALRLSIHPQPDVSAKIGVHLLPTEDAWLTPWHGVALLEGERFRLVPREEAERLGARVVEEDGRPSYFEVAS